MRPALSVIVFTVLSGAGLGLFAILAIGDLYGGALGVNTPVISDRAHLVGGAIALSLVAIGLMSSTLHLANPRNAWRAVSQFRYSWLSREAVLAIAFFPIAVGYLIVAHWGVFSALREALAVAAILGSWGILFCTGMIYACLKTIPQWHTNWVPSSYVVLGHWSGALMAASIAALGSADVTGYIALCWGLMVASAVVKAAYYFRFRRPDRNARTLVDALGVTAAAAKLLDVGHAQRTFLTQEFMFRVARRHAFALRLAFMVCCFVVPLLTLASGTREAAFFVFAAVACLAGLLVERWLFFAEAEHIVRLYHGQQRV